MSAGNKLLQGILHSQDVTDLLTLEVGPEHFGVNERERFEFIQNHVKKYGSIPAVSTYESHFSCTTSKPDEPIKYYEDLLKKRFLHRSLKKALIEASDLLKNMQPEEALDFVAQKTMELSRKRYGKKILDFRQAKDVIIPMYKQKIVEGDDYGLRFNWKYLDDMAGGLGAGDLLSIVARSGQGKTFLLLYMAHCAWKLHSKVPMFITTEMKPGLIFQRLAAMDAHKNLTKLQNAAMTSKNYKGLVQTLVMNQKRENPFYVVDAAGKTTVEDIWMLAQQLKPDAIFIDGAYLLSHPDQRMRKFDRISENAEMIKNALANDLGLPVACTYQINREGSKKKLKKGEKPDMSTIAGSDSIPQLSSVVLALLEEDILETMNRREVTVLKGRNGEQGDFYINWDFEKMDFSQWEKPTMEDLQFI